MPIDHPDFASPLVAGSNILYSNSAFLVPAGGQLGSGAIDVSSFAQLFVQVTNPAMALGNYSVTFYADLGLANPVGASGFWWKSGAGTVNMFLAVQGPVAQFVCNNSDGANRNQVVNIYGLTNVTPPALIYPATQIAFTNTAGVAINGTAIVQCAPSMNCDGVLFVNSGNAPVQGRVDWWNGAAWLFYAFLPVAAISQGVTARIAMPFSDSRIVVTNISSGVAVLQAGIVAPAG